MVVDPPSVEDTISILRGIKPDLESHHGISIADDPLIQAVKLSERYIPDRFLPDKGMHFLSLGWKHYTTITWTVSTLFSLVDHQLSIWWTYLRPS